MATGWMINMKIGTKLLMTYFLLILSLFFITSVSFHFISQRYLIHETGAQLQKEAKIMSGFLSKTALSNELVQEKLAKRKALTITKKLLSSKMIIQSERQEIVYTDLNGTLLKQFLQNRNGGKFVSKTAAITSKNGRTKGYVTLIARLDELQEINSLMRKSQLISLAISAFIAVCLGLFFEKSLTKPIRLLTKHMKNYSVQSAGREITLQTKDEIGELANSFNTLSRKLKQYDAGQRKFFQNASHELKTPLMAIQGNAEGILDGVVTGEEIPHSLQVIITESQRLKRIVDGITYLAKLESVEETFVFTEDSLARIIQEAVQSVAALAEQKGVAILIENDVVETVRVDQEKMKRAFINLLGNAIRYAESTIIVKSYRINQQVVIEVQDDGSGLSPGEENKVFQRFYSGEAGGSGIGLAITKAIIEGHNGTITAINRHPKGAVFRINLVTGTI
jgi:signal transduction histidine kinase